MCPHWTSRRGRPAGRRPSRRGLSRQSVRLGVQGHLVKCMKREEGRGKREGDRGHNLEDCSGCRYFSVTKTPRHQDFNLWAFAPLWLKKEGPMKRFNPSAGKYVFAL